MIWDSYPWKRYLYKIANYLEKQSKQKKWRKESDFILEKNIFQSAYIIRKLFDTFKLTYNLRNYSIPIIKYPNIKHADQMNWHNIYKFYNFENGTNENLNIQDFCNIAIHSFVFMATVNQSALEGILINSDKIKNNFVYSIQIHEIINIIRIISVDEKMDCRITRDKNGDWVEDDPDNPRKKQQNK